MWQTPKTIECPSNIQFGRFCYSRAVNGINLCIGLATIFGESWKISVLQFFFGIVWILLQNSWWRDFWFSVNHLHSSWSDVVEEEWLKIWAIFLKREFVYGCWLDGSQPSSFFTFFTLMIISPLTRAFLLNSLSSDGWKASTESPMTDSS